MRGLQLRFGAFSVSRTPLITTPGFVYQQKAALEAARLMKHIPRRHPDGCSGFNSAASRVELIQSNDFMTAPWPESNLKKNCLFRALGDQLEGHSRNHLKHRQDTVAYMIQQRPDFEPFVEDDVPFEKHSAWSPSGSQTPPCPAGLSILQCRRCQFGPAGHVCWQRRHRSLCEEQPSEHCYSPAKRPPLAEEDQANRPNPQPRPALWDEKGSRGRTLGRQEAENNNSPRGNLLERNRPGQKASTKQKKELQRLEKKKRQEDRHRQKVLAGKGGPSDNNTVSRDPQAQVTLVKTFAALSI
ncbi:hypothetical protein L345_05745, partial [Ophiophagus hannah]